MIRFRSALLLIVCFGLLPGLSHGFEVKTHSYMNREAAKDATPDGFQLGNFLKQELGAAFVDGLATPLKVHTVAEWLEEGGQREDDLTPYAAVLGSWVWGDDSLLPGRFNRHFHDPLVSSWAEAGLQAYLFEVVPVPIHFLSSVQWMQLDDGVDAGAVFSDGQGWSWPDARRAYYHALTLSNPQQREQQWADTFRALGQIMHLVEDTASPAHVRNDPHGMATVCRWLGASCFRNFESHVDEYLGTDEFSFDPVMASPRFDRDILYQPTFGHSEAPVSVARLIDTDTYQCGFGFSGSSCDSKVTYPNSAIGLAEFTNANFFSEDTVPFFGVGNYPFPDVTRLVPVTYPAASGYNRRYFKKAADDGKPVDLVMVGSAWTIAFDGNPGAQYVIGGTTDDNVWSAMAPILVPKAVDYAQGVLEYFFRGRFDFCHGGRGGFSAIRNTGPEALHGVFALYYDDSANVRHNVGQWRTEDYLPLSASGWLFPGDVLRVPDGDVPTDPPPTSYILVFHGDMGSEVEDPNNPASVGAGAVAAKVIPASQQCPQTLWQWTATGVVVAYNLGPDGVPNGVSGSFVPPVEGVVFGGVAFDPTDGNLWYTGSNGMLIKVTPDGTFVTAIPVVGTFFNENPYSGQPLGAPQTDFSAIDTDPNDPHFLWVSGFSSTHWDYVPLYKVRTSDGQVVQANVIVRSDGGLYGSAVNWLLAAGRYGGGTALIAAPSQNWQWNRVFGWETQGWMGIGVWDIWPFEAPMGVAINGAGDWVVGAIDEESQWRFLRYTPESIPLWGGYVQDPAASAPGQPGWDLALGVSPEWPATAP